MQIPSYKEALKVVLDRFEPLDAEIERIDSCLNRVTAEDLRAKRSIPFSDVSRVDGYALSSSQNYRWVNTGEVLPESFDRVVKVEDVVEEDGKLLYKKKPGKWENVRRKGEDIKEGEVLLKKGSFIDALKLVTLKNCGIKEVKVFRKPRIAILATGDELGKEIPATNHLMLSFLLERLCEVRSYFAKDSRDQIESFLLRKGYDALITTGGTSKGRKDLLRKVLTEIGEIYFEGSKIKPGRTAFFGEIRESGTPVFCLPGTPSACLSAFMLYVKPAVLKMVGLKESAFKATISGSISPSKNTRFILLNLDGGKATLLNGEFFRSLLSANCYFVLEEGMGVEEGEAVEVHPLSLHPEF